MRDTSYDALAPHFSAHARSRRRYCDGIDRTILTWLDGRGAWLDVGSGDGARAAAEAKGNQSPGHAPSILKNSATWVAQTRAELTLEIMGQQGLGWEGDAFQKDEIEAVRGWLSGKAMSIYGGSQEIQWNIITKAILGLPETTQQG